MVGKADDAIMIDLIEIYPWLKRKTNFNYKIGIRIISLGIKDLNRILYFLKWL